MIYDLHTHSNASDGSLDPDELLALAAQNNVDVLSITDHDTVSAYDRLGARQQGTPLLIPGIELSTTWAGRGIHIVGLNIDPASSTLCRGIVEQQAARLKRARKIADRLTRLGIDNPFDAVCEMAGDAGIGRPHFARHLVATGVTKDTATAFRKYLGTGKAGDVRSGWAELSEVIRWIQAAGGEAVLAHPAKYKFTATKLRCLIKDFVNAGGTAIEVISGQQDSATTKKLADIATDFELAASTGSDFHHPELSWSAPGRFPALPDNIETVWTSWQS
ncbi:MAG: PHP domain-containing protein [Gammaproteobacteria bacterium]|nr:PHP domain-containing protein [Gammaproteobacteria bacterium]